MMNKKGFIARDFVVAMLLFSGILTLLIIAVASHAQDYGNDNVVDEEFSDNFNRFNEEVNRTGEIFDSATGESGLSLVGTFDVLFSSTFTIISLVFGGVSAVGSQVSGFGEYFGIPSGVASVFFTLILAVLTVIIVFIVISSVSRRDL